MGWAERCNKRKAESTELAARKNSPYPAVRSGYNHAEAFSLMTYCCESLKCNNRIRVYNSRDGVTPYVTMCPICKGEMVHSFRDVFYPDYALKPGDYYFRDMTREELLEALRYQVERYYSTRQGGSDDEKEAVLQRLFESQWREGIPALRVWEGEEKC